MSQARPRPLGIHVHADVGFRSPPLPQAPQAGGRLSRLGLPSICTPLLLQLVGGGGAGGRAGIISRLFCGCCAGQSGKNGGGDRSGVVWVNQGDGWGRLRPTQCCTCRCANNCNQCLAKQLGGSAIHPTDTQTASTGGNACEGPWAGDILDFSERSNMLKLEFNLWD